jgi:hypothetical protein
LQRICPLVYTTELSDYQSLLSNFVSGLFAIINEQLFQGAFKKSLRVTARIGDVRGIFSPVSAINGRLFEHLGWN